MNYCIGEYKTGWMVPEGSSMAKLTGTESWQNRPRLHHIYLMYFLNVRTFGSSITAVAQSTLYSVVHQSQQTNFPHPLRAGKLLPFLLQLKIESQPASQLSRPSSRFIEQMPTVRKSDSASTHAFTAMHTTSKVQFLASKKQYRVYGFTFK